MPECNGWTTPWCALDTIANAILRPMHRKPEWIERLTGPILEWTFDHGDAHCPYAKD